MMSSERKDVISNKSYLSESHEKESLKENLIIKLPPPPPAATVSLVSSHSRSRSSSISSSYYHSANSSYVTVLTDNNNFNNSPTHNYTKQQHQRNHYYNNNNHINNDIDFQKQYHNSHIHNSSFDKYNVNFHHSLDKETELQRCSQTKQKRIVHASSNTVPVSSLPSIPYGPKETYTYSSTPSHISHTKDNQVKEILVSKSQSSQEKRESQEIENPTLESEFSMNSQTQNHKYTTGSSHETYLSSNVNKENVHEGDFIARNERVAARRRLSDALSVLKRKPALSSFPSNNITSLKEKMTSTSIKLTTTIPGDDKTLVSSKKVHLNSTYSSSSNTLPNSCESGNPNTHQTNLFQVHKSRESQQQAILSRLKTITQASGWDSRLRELIVTEATLNTNNNSNSVTFDGMLLSRERTSSMKTDQTIRLNESDIVLNDREQKFTRLFSHSNQFSASSIRKLKEKQSLLLLRRSKTTYKQYKDWKHSSFQEIKPCMNLSSLSLDEHNQEEDEDEGDNEDQFDLKENTIASCPTSPLIGSSPALLDELDDDQIERSLILSSITLTEDLILNSNFMNDRFKNSCSNFSDIKTNNQLDDTRTNDIQVSKDYIKQQQNQEMNNIDAERKADKDETDTQSIYESISMNWDQRLREIIKETFERTSSSHHQQRLKAYARHKRRTIFRPQQTILE